MNKTVQFDKLNEIEWIRAICCLLVIVIHVTAAFWFSFEKGTIHYAILVIINTISKFVVPCFVFISGFVLYYVYSRKSFETISFYTKRLKKIIIPYLIWSTIYILINYSNTLDTIKIRQILYFLLLGKSNYHLYFMCLIIQLYLIFPLCLRLYSVFKQKIIPTAILFTMNIILIVFIKMDYKDRFFINYLIFFGLGFILAEYKIQRYKIDKLVTTLIFSLYFIITTYHIVETYRVLNGVQLLSKLLYRYSWWYFSIISIIAIYILSIIIKERRYKWLDNKYINSLSKQSFTIYLSHSLFMKILHKQSFFINMKSYSLTLAFIFELIIIISTTWMFSVLLDKCVNRLVYSKKNIVKLT